MLLCVFFRNRFRYFLRNVSGPIRKSDEKIRKVAKCLFCTVYIKNSYGFRIQGIIARDFRVLFAVQSDGMELPIFSFRLLYFVNFKTMPKPAYSFTFISLLFSPGNFQTEFAFPCYVALHTRMEFTRRFSSNRFFFFPFVIKFDEYHDGECRTCAFM